MSYKPRDLFPSTLEVAQLFLRAYDQVEEGKQEAKEALCEKYGVPEKEAFRWIHVVRPHFRDQGDSWPFYGDIEARALDPSEHSDEAKVDSPTGVDSPGEDETEDDDGHVVVETRAKLAELIGADTTTVWRGVDQNRPAKGYPVHEWVRLDEKGHIDHFEVPAATDLVGDAEEAEDGTSQSESSQNEAPQAETSEAESPEDTGPVADEGKQSFYEGDLVQIAPDSLYDPFPSPGEVVGVDRTNGQIRVQFPQGKTDWMGKGHFQKLDNQDRGVSHAHSDEARPEDPAEDPAGGSDEETSTPGGWSWDKDYVYNAAQDTYLFHLSQYEGAPFVVEGDKLRRMVRRYSKHAGDRAWNLDEVAAAEGMPRDAWQEIKQNLGITHTSPPHLPEDFQREDDIEGMAADDVQKKKHEWKKHNEQKTYRELKTAAEKWHKFEGAVERSNELFQQEMEDYEPPEANIQVTDVQGLEDAALVVPIHDLHYGKYATREECGARYDREIAAQRAHTAVDEVLEQSLRVANIKKIITVCGTSDFYHIDADKPAATGSGTPQDADGTYEEIMAGGRKLGIEILDKMRSVAPVENHYCPGNHAPKASSWMHAFLDNHFRRADDVTHTKDRRGRQYWTFGVNRGVMFHGDAPKKQIRKIGNIFAREHGFGEYTFAISGHKHFSEFTDKAGLLMHQFPSLSGSDKWTDDNLYSSLEALQSFVLGKESGPLSMPTYYV